MRFLAPALAAVVAALVSTGCAREDAAAEQGTAEMAARLQQIYQQAMADPVPYFHLNHRRVELARRDIEQAAASRPEVRFYFVLELLNAGQVDEAIREILQLLPRFGRGGFELSTRTKPMFDMLGIAYLRQGIQRNCMDDSADACILPLIRGGIHASKQPARQAIFLYEQLLTAFPEDLQTRWLLNIAYMMVGEYPHGVPARWLIPGLEASAGARLPRFRNVAPALGLAVNGVAGGVSLEDFNGDGFIDVFATAYGLNDPVRLFIADGRGGFSDRTKAAGLEGIVSGLNTIHADYDNDGDVDILVLRGAWLGAHGAHPNSLLRNNGNGTFEDVTAAAGLLSFHPTQTAAWGDFNNDGLLDLFIGNESGSQYRGMGGAQDPAQAGVAAPPHFSELYLNKGDGTFREIAARVGLNIQAFVKGVAWGDINNDGLLDLFVSVLGGPNRLYVNRGGSRVDDWRFEEVAASAGVQEPLFSFPCWFWDFDNDGWEDLFVASYDVRDREAAATVAREFLKLNVPSERARLFRNNGNGTFTDVAPKVGLDRALYAMGANFGDLDNDGYPDIYIGTGAPDLRALIPNRMFHNRGGKHFDDVTFDGGFGHLQKGHGIAFADLDRDGDQDIYADMGGAVEGDAFANVVFENPNPAPENAWIVLKLEGRMANRSAIGARIAITVQTKNGERRVIHSTVSTGGSFGASSLQQEIGLGAVARITELRVTWPNRQRTVDVYTSVALNRYYDVIEGAGIRPLRRAPVRLGGAPVQ